MPSKILQVLPAKEFTTVQMISRVNGQKVNMSVHMWVLMEGEEGLRSVEGVVLSSEGMVPVSEVTDAYFGGYSIPTRSRCRCERGD